MPRYVALLRGVSPTNASMPELKRCFEAAGFTAVRTLLASGNVAFDAPTAEPAELARQAERAMLAGLGRSFGTVVRSSAFLQGFIESDPFGAFELPAAAKRVVTFLPGGTAAGAASGLVLPLEQEGASILACTGSEVLSAYVPHPKGPVFMTLIERTFGRQVTTRTWDTVRKCARA